MMGNLGPAGRMRCTGVAARRVATFEFDIYLKKKKMEIAFVQD